MGDTTKRASRSPEERIAAAKAELELLEAKAVAVAQRQYDKLDVQRAKLVAVIEDYTSKVEAIDEQLAALVEQVPELGESSTPTLSVVEDEADEDEAAV